MKTQYKVAAGISFLLLAFLWALRTKNEVVASIVMPLKVKLGLASINSDANTAVNAKQAEADKIFAKAKEKMTYVPASKTVTGGHYLYGEFGDELQQLWPLGYDLRLANETAKGGTLALVKISDAEAAKMMEMHKGSAIGLANAQEQLTNKLLLSNKYPDVIGVGRVKIGLADGYEIALLKGKDHSAVLNLFPNRKYGGYPLQFREMGMPVAQTAQGAKGMPYIDNCFSLN